MSTVHAIPTRERPRVNSTDRVNLPLRPAKPAHVIRSDAEAIEVAHRLAAQFAPGAAQRDKEGLLPIDEIEAFSQSGLWGITVPRSHGGAGVSTVTLNEVIKIISAADPAIGQIPQNHFGCLGVVHFDATEEQKKFFYAEVLAGVRFGNAFSEAGSKTVTSFETRVERRSDSYVLNGQKFYCTGAILAHYVPIVGIDAQGVAYLAFAERNAAGLEISNDWSSFGQRTTASGTVTIKDVVVPASHTVIVRCFDHPTALGPISNVIQAAVDAGIARAAIGDTIEFVRTRARPWADSGQEHASQDPYTIQAIGDLQIRLHAAEAILDRASRFVDEAVEKPNEDTVARASIAVAEAKVLTTEVAILASNKLFELGGTRSTLAAHQLDRHWRNARTHTLHDPVRWKYFHVGNFYLNDVKPPRHAWI